MNPAAARMRIPAAWTFPASLSVVVAAGWFVAPSFTVGVANHFAVFFVEMIVFLPVMFLLIGLFDEWVPREVVAKHVGEGSGWKGMTLVVLLAMLQAGPLYGAFPVAYLLWRKGCGVRNVYIYLGAFTAMKIPMVMFEVGFLGWKFSVARTVLTLPVFVAIAHAMDAYHRRYPLHMTSPEREDGTHVQR